MQESKNKATWIWFPGDFEIWLGNIFNNRRTERGAMFPPFWKQDSHWVTVEFSKSFELTEAEIITIACEGQFNLALDGKLSSPALGEVRRGLHYTLTVPKGQHKLNIKIWNQATPPALFIDGKTIKTDSSWLVTYEDKIWIDENGVAHGSGIYVPAASWNFDSIETSPSAYRLERRELRPVSRRGTTTDSTGGTLYDFGRETFGYLKVMGLKGTVRIYYGESKEEALDKEHCETLDVLHEGDLLGSKAFRYVYIEKEEGSSYDEVLMDYEYAPHDLQHSGSFRCSDEELNRIWEVAAYTMDLTTREFFLDGIKRDRWTWSGDAIQSYLMNYYLRFDTECVKRTIRQLRGKDPVTTHVNTIMDYTFYWFKSILDYYQYTGDTTFIREIYPRMVTLMDYCIIRTNTDGLMEGLPDDWIFVDWVDFPMHKRGVLCFEQILFVEALRAMAVCSRLCNDDDDGYYQMEAERTLKKVKDLFWSEERHAFLHAIEDGTMNPQITKFPNMFAIICDDVTPTEKDSIMEHVMLNPNVDPITTPYMRFYELEALCMMGQQTKVLSEMKAYWGGMLREGATSFWEKYNPEEKGTEHLAMYGRPYGKSLCHAWGASPIYIIGKYFLGVRPVTPGYETYEVRPTLGGLEWMEGEVPTPFGKISIKMDQQKVAVFSDGGQGSLVLGDQLIDIPPQQEINITL
jgi:hypothetical protein